MRRVVFIYLLTLTALLAQTTDCTKIFEERKGELIKELDQIDEARQSFEALKAASNALFVKQEEELNKKELELNELQNKIDEDKKRVEALIEENREILSLINEAKDNRLIETYSKMKDSAAALILQEMDRKEAASIFFALPPKKISAILAKMEPQIASEITTLLKAGPPF